MSFSLFILLTSCEQSTCSDTPCGCQAPLFRIVNPHQTQPVWRGRWTRVRLICILYDSSKLSQAETPLPYQQQCSDDSANHPCKKSVRSKITIDESLILSNLPLTACL